MHGMGKRLADRMLHSLVATPACKLELRSEPEHDKCMELSVNY